MEKWSMGSTASPSAVGIKKDWKKEKTDMQGRQKLSHSETKMNTNRNNGRVEKVKFML